MRPFLVVTAALAVTAATAWPQSEPIRVYTDPKPPPRDVLDRLSLTLSWSIRLKTHGIKDGLLSVQLLPDTGKQRLLVQTLYGDVTLLDAETGDPIWTTHVGTPYEVGQLAGFNSQAVFVSRKDHVYVLDRETGKQLLWDVEKDSALPLWGQRIDGIPAAGLSADEQMLYVSMDTRISAYFVPDFRTLFRLRAQQGVEAGKRLPSPQLRRDWTRFMPPHHFSQPPFVSRDSIGIISDDGTFLVFKRLDGAERYSYQVEKPIAAPAAQHGANVYIASLDYQLYAFDMDRARLRWRFTGTAPVSMPVQATDRDVFVAPDRVGLFRLDRATGGERWLARGAQRFLATNGKYLYAFDSAGHLLVLDYDRGTQLACWDTRDYTVPVPNEWTDRLYLAAHNGLIVCLHHRAIPAPLKIKTPPWEEKIKLPPKGKKGGEKKAPPKLGEDTGALPRSAPGLPRVGRTPRMEAARLAMFEQAFLRRPEPLACEAPQ
jgi:outer membrane protein assembly factor BamB